MNRYLLDRLMHDGRHDREYQHDSRHRDRRYEDEEHDSRRIDREYREPRDSRMHDGRRDRAYDDYDDPRDFEYNSRSKPIELTKKELKEWERDMENSDGSRGAKFTKDQIIPIAQQHGIKFDKFTEDEFVVAVNVFYADCYEAVRDMAAPNPHKPEPYILLAKYFFFCDKDFKGKPYEKLAIYYHTIVEFEDE